MNHRVLEKSSEGYRGLYLERSGVNARELVETLMKPPEILLNDAEKAEAYEFEASLSRHLIRVDSDDTETPITIETLIKSQKSESVNAPLFFAQPFLEGSVDLTRWGNPQFATQDEVYRWLAGLMHTAATNASVLRSLAKQSTDVYKKKVSQALISLDDSPAGDLRDVPVSEQDLASMSLVLQPEQLIQLCKDIEEARRFLLTLRSQYKEEYGDPLDGAKHAIVDVYLSRINEVIAKSIPQADYVINQSRMINDEHMIERMEAALPPAVRSILNSDKMKSDFFKRLDYLRNGLAVDEDGLSTSISGELMVVPDQTDKVVEHKAIFSPDQVEVLRHTMLAPDQIKEVFSRVIARAGLLSQEDPTTWGPERTTRAADGLFQVVQNPDKATFAVDSTSGVFKYPPESCSLYTVLSTGSHELSHIDQAQADRELGKLLRIGEVKGKRTSGLRESGADMRQREAEIRFFGASKPLALTYARALNTLASGGSLLDAIRAFYAEKRHLMPEVPAAKAAQEAADRVLRLVRQGGQESQALVYAEGGILAKELAGAPPELKDRAVAITGLDHVDQVRLHRYGLLPDIASSTIDWPGLLLDEIRPYIVQAISEQEG